MDRVTSALPEIVTLEPPGEFQQSAAVKLKEAQSISLERIERGIEHSTALIRSESDSHQRSPGISRRPARQNHHTDIIRVTHSVSTYTFIEFSL